MNLNAYDIVPETLDKNRTWIIPATKTLLSREIKFRKYYCLSKKYNPQQNLTTYFIILLDNPPDNRTYHMTRIDNYGRIKLRLNVIWNDTILPTLNKSSNININHIESADDGDIYELDI